jgi:DNA-binding Lrp family transcriptional regulator
MVALMPSAFVLMKCKEGAENKIIENLTEARQIEIQHTIGHYDMITKVTSKNSYDLDEIIDEIRRHDKIGSIKVLRTNEASVYATS